MNSEDEPHTSLPDHTHFQRSVKPGTWYYVSPERWQNEFSHDSKKRYNQIRLICETNAGVQNAIRCTGCVKQGADQECWSFTKVAQQKYGLIKDNCARCRKHRLVCDAEERNAGHAIQGSLLNEDGSSNAPSEAQPKRAADIVIVGHEAKKRMERSDRAEGSTPLIVDAMTITIPTLNTFKTLTDASGLSLSKEGQDLDRELRASADAFAEECEMIRTAGDADIAALQRRRREIKETTETKVAKLLAKYNNEREVVYLRYRKEQLARSWAEREARDMAEYEEIEKRHKELEVARRGSREDVSSPVGGNAVHTRGPSFEAEHTTSPATAYRIIGQEVNASPSPANVLSGARQYLNYFSPRQGSRDSTGQGRGPSVQSNTMPPWAIRDKGSLGSQSEPQVQARREPPVDELLEEMYR